MSPPTLTVRRATHDDLSGILELARRALGWAGDADDHAFFRWKHFENPFGLSPMWVALDGDRIVGVRVFLRWQFHRSDGALVPAVRAVDTATDPEYQGRGVFTRLTLGAVDELRAEGVQLIFNTPNAQSLAGYLKMGWSRVGRLAVAAMPGRGSSALAILTARGAAGRSSIQTEVGSAAAEVFADRAVTDHLLSTEPAADGLSTARSPDFFAWRYGHRPLRYRVVWPGSTPSNGLAVFRVRTRGRATELAVCELVGDARDPATTRVLLRDVARRAQASYVVRLDRTLLARGPFVRVPRTGPVLACRRLDGGRVPQLEEWDLTLGDVELF